MYTEDYLPDNIDCDIEVRKEIIRKIEALSSLSEDFPVYIVHELTSGKDAVVYMSPQGLAGIGMTLAEVRALGGKYHELFFNKADVEDYLSKWQAFADDYSNRGIWYTFFQQVKVLDSEKPFWFLSASTVIAYREEDKTPLFSMTLALRINQYMPIVAKLEKILDENNFIKNNLHLYTALTKREKEIVHEMALGFTPQQIAEKLYTAEDTVRTHRRNIKRKLKIKNDVELVNFARAFDIV